MLHDLIGHFSHVTELPVELDEIVERAIRTGIQDEILLTPDDYKDPKILRGVFAQYKRVTGVYRDPDFVTDIAYSSRLPQEWQRVVVAKELVHLFDTECGKTGTQDEVAQLLDDLAKPLGDYGLGDFQALTDRFALYRSLPLLLPEAALDEARRAVREGSKTVQDVAEWSCLPVEIVMLMLGEVWGKLSSATNKL